MQTRHVPRRLASGASTPRFLVVCGVVAALSLLYAVVAELSFVRTVALNSPVEVLLLGVPAVGLVTAGLWLESGDFDVSDLGAVGALSVAGVLVATVTTTLLLAVATPAGTTTQATVLLLISTGTEGALVGALVGVASVGGDSEGREDVDADRLTAVTSLVRHNVRNRLSLAHGHLEELLDDVEDYDESRARRVRTQHDAILDIGDDASVVAEAAVGAREHTAVDLVDVVTEQVTLLETTCESATVTTDLPAEAPVRADELLGAVVENVLQNAVEHNDSPNPKVSVSITGAGDVVNLEVTDDGPGVPDDRKAAVFEPEVGDGSGMGLFLVETLVESYGGTVTMLDADDGGTTVRITLPRAQ
jgi:signal transduction histidine kinase